MTVAGLIFSNIHDAALPELTARRTLGSLPFGCRYRLIDFPLSNMVNSGITKVGVIAHNNYQSLMDHIGTGKDWDLARRSGGIKILPPFITAFDHTGGGALYATRLEALLGVTNFISRCTEDTIVLSDCDVICNIDLSDVLEAHDRADADLTLVTRRPVAEDLENHGRLYTILSDGEGRVQDVAAYSVDTRKGNVSTNIMVFKRTFLLSLLHEADSRNYRNFYRDLVTLAVKRNRVCEYLYEGYYLQITSLESYFASSMALLSSHAREELFGVKYRPIYTKVRNSAPTIYTNNARVKSSYIADGCVIDGTVENSIIFRGVKIGKGTVVRNSILLQDTFTGENVTLNCVITDKNAVIKDGRLLSGHTTMPFFVGKGMTV